MPHLTSRISGSRREIDLKCFAVIGKDSTAFV
jgi:hypothetical protein